MFKKPSKKPINWRNSKATTASPRIPLASSSPSEAAGASDLNLLARASEEAEAEGAEPKPTTNMASEPGEGEPLCTGTAWKRDQPAKAVGCPLT